MKREVFHTKGQKSERAKAFSSLPFSGLQSWTPKSLRLAKAGSLFSFRLFSPLVSSFLFLFFLRSTSISALLPLGKLQSSLSKLASSLRSLSQARKPLGTLASQSRNCLVAKLATLSPSLTLSLATSAPLITSIQKLTSPSQQVGKLRKT